MDAKDRFNIIDEILNYEPTMNILSGLNKARIEDYRTFMFYAKKAAQKDPIKMAPIMLEIMEEFYSRTDGGNIHIKKIYTNYGRIEMEYWHKSKRVNGAISINDRRWTAFHKDNDMSRMDTVCERLGIPAPYLTGVFDAVQHLTEGYKSSVKICNKKLVHRELKNYRAFYESEKRLKQIEQEISERQKRLSRFANAVSPYKMPLPQECITISDVQERYRKKPGVYIAFHETSGQCMYVGKSKNLGARVNKGRDEIKDCVLGIVEFTEDDLIWAECYYIWYYRPYRNANVHNQNRKDRQC